MKKASSAEVAPTKPGTPFAGGLFCFNLFDEKLKPYRLIVATAEGELGSLTHKQALAKATKLKLGGKKDWALPTRAEALAMWEHLQPKVDGTADAFQAAWYWTGQRFEPGSDDAWIQGFYYGGQLGHLTSLQFRARAVRREPV